jgi:hypothetical protein
MDPIAAKLSARLDAEDRLSNMALMRRAADELVREIRLRMQTVERVCKCDFASAPERMAVWAIGHSITTFSHPITGDTQVLVRYPNATGGYFDRAILTVNTPAHGQELARYLEQRFCISWDRGELAKRAA